jgi:hypothetical protein
MQELIIVLSSLSVMFIFMHEFDAFHRGEWKMFGFLQTLDERKQYLFFLYAHIPLTLFMFYYLWTIISFNNIALWVIVNVFWILHFLLHTIARKWKSNVFDSFHSFIFIGGAAITGFLNLSLIAYY